MPSSAPSSSAPLGPETHAEPTAVRPSRGLEGIGVLLFVTTPALREALRIVFGHHGATVLFGDPSAPVTSRTLSASVDVAVVEHPEHGAPLYEICREWRRQTSLPLLVIGPAEDELIEAAYRYVGADEYLRRPLSPSALTERLQRLIAHRRLGEPAPNTAVLDTRRHRLLCGGAIVDLTPRETQLFDILAQHAGSPVARGTLLERVWGNHRPDLGARTVDTTVARIRRELRAVGHPNCIETVPGVGYRLRACRLLQRIPDGPTGPLPRSGGD